MTQLLPAPLGAPIPWNDGEEICMERTFQNDSGDFVGVSFLDLFKNRKSKIDLVIYCPHELRSDAGADGNGEHVIEKEIDSSSAAYRREDCACDCYYILKNIDFA